MTEPKTLLKLLMTTASTASLSTLILWHWKSSNFSFLQGQLIRFFVNGNLFRSFAVGHVWQPLIQSADREAESPPVISTAEYLPMLDELSQLLPKKCDVLRNLGSCPSPRKSLFFIFLDVGWMCLSAKLRKWRGRQRLKINEQYHSASGKLWRDLMVSFDCPLCFSPLEGF